MSPVGRLSQRVYRLVVAPMVRFPEIVVLAALAVAAVLPFGRLYDSNRYLIYVAFAAALSMLVSGAFSRRSWYVATAGSIAALAIYLIFVVYRVGVPSAAELKDVWSGVTGSWASTLTTTLP